jgi:ribosome-associated protein
MIKITETLSIPNRELSYVFSRSSKPGGQNVNKVNTRVALTFSVKDSPSLSEDQKMNIMVRLRTRINKRGYLQVVSYRYRTQERNRSAVVERFISLMRDALAEQKPRKATRVSKAVQKRRLEAKKRRGQLKQSRSSKPDSSNRSY